MFVDKAYEGIDCIISPFKEDFLDTYRLKAKQWVKGASELLDGLEGYNAALEKYRIRVEQGIGKSAFSLRCYCLAHCRLVQHVFCSVSFLD